MGEIEVINIDDDAPNGYYLVEWVSLPYTCQDTGDLLCDGRYLNPVPCAPFWYTPSNLEPDTHNVKNVLFGNVMMEGISDTNTLPNTCDVVGATAKGAMKVNAEEHGYILEVRRQRDSFENPIYDSSEAEDSDVSSSENSSSE